LLNASLKSLLPALLQVELDSLVAAEAATRTAHNERELKQDPEGRKRVNIKLSFEAPQEARAVEVLVLTT